MNAKTYLVASALFLTACGGGVEPPDPQVAFGCSLAGSAFQGYEPTIPPRSELEIGAELTTDGTVLGRGLPADSLDVNRSYSQLSCTDSSTLHGKITLGIAGLLGLDAEGTRQAAQALVLDTIEIVRVGEVASITAESRRKYAWEGIRVRSMTFDASRVNGLTAQTALQRLRTELGIGGRVSSETRLHLHGENLFVAWRARKFGETASELIVMLRTDPNGPVNDFRLGDYRFDFTPVGSGWTLSASTVTSVRPDTFAVAPGDFSLVLRRRQVGGSMEVERIVVRDLSAAPSGVLGSFRLERDQIPFQAVPVDETASN